MSTMPLLPSYTEVTDALKTTPANFNAAQVHGLMCGLICATSGKIDRRWEPLIFGKNHKDQRANDILSRLYEDSYHQMCEFSFEFTLLLPTDSMEITARAEALGLWCQGFLTGLEHGNAKLKNASTEINETLNDITEISQINYEEINKDEEDEVAYFELVEYVRLAALMIFHELRADAQPNTSENNWLH